MVKKAVFDGGKIIGISKTGSKKSINNILARQKRKEGRISIRKIGKPRMKKR